MNTTTRVPLAVLSCSAPPVKVVSVDIATAGKVAQFARREEIDATAGVVVLRSDGADEEIIVAPEARHRRGTRGGASFLSP